MAARWTKTNNSAASANRLTIFTPRYTTLASFAIPFASSLWLIPLDDIDYRVPCARAFSSCLYRFTWHGATDYATDFCAAVWPSPAFGTRMQNTNRGLHTVYMCVCVRAHTEILCACQNCRASRFISFGIQTRYCYRILRLLVRLTENRTAIKRVSLIRF